MSSGFGSFASSSSAASEFWVFYTRGALQTIRNHILPLGSRITSYSSSYIFCFSCWMMSHFFLCSNSHPSALTFSPYCLCLPVVCLCLCCWLRLVLRRLQVPPSPPPEKSSFSGRLPKALFFCLDWFFLVGHLSSCGWFLVGW